MSDHSFGSQTLRVGQALGRMWVFVIVAYALNACSTSATGTTQPPAEPTWTPAAVQTQTLTIPLATQTPEATETSASAAS